MKHRDKQAGYHMAGENVNLQVPSTTAYIHMYSLEPHNKYKNISMKQ